MGPYIQNRIQATARRPRRKYPFNNAHQDGLLECKIWDLDGRPLHCCYLCASDGGKKNQGSKNPRKSVVEHIEAESFQRWPYNFAVLGPRRTTRHWLSSGLRCSLHDSSTKCEQPLIQRYRQLCTCAKLYHIQHWRRVCRLHPQSCRSSHGLRFAKSLRLSPRSRAGQTHK